MFSDHKPTHIEREISELLELIRRDRARCDALLGELVDNAAKLAAVKRGWS